MPAWRNRNLQCTGSVLFRGSLPPRLENFTQLAPANVRVRMISPGDDVHWAAELEHPAWGNAKIVALRNPPRVPRAVVQFDPRLSDDERRLATDSQASVSIRMEGAKQNVLRDRKLLLRYLRCLLGDDGLICVDHLAMKFWTREALDEELAHDADLDIDSMFIAHLVYDPPAEQPESPAKNEPDGDGERNVFWAHTHGLAELGTLDFDILRPSSLVTGSAFDLFRSLAFLLLEGKVDAGTRSTTIVLPHGLASFVPVEEFNRKGPREDRALRGDPQDPIHNTRRVILCDPRGGGWRRWLPSPIRPSRFLSRLEDDHLMLSFPSAATDLMAERARKTFDILRSLFDEFRELRVKPLVKLGYRVDGGEPNEREHMWFELHACGTDTMDATLINDPFNIARLKNGQRDTHSLDLLTDWLMITPIGSISPRDMSVARRIRVNRDKVLQIIALHDANTAAGAAGAART